MMVVKINLLPAEIQNKRRAEKFLLAGLVGMVAIAACLAGIFLYNVWRIDNAEKDLVLLSDQVVKMESAIQELRVYEARLAEVQKKKDIVEKALADRILWSKLLEELMIITPNDLSLATLSGNADGVTFSGEIQDPLDAPDSGHKPVAKWLIRLGELRLQPDVWLSSSDKQDKRILFSNTMKFKKEPMPPAPPNPSGT
ncbi:MAG: hypothetical protein QME41_00105 [Actinomycetota bacterium]|nr:hypothetical protein [Actinomycetota bacterium]